MASRLVQWQPGQQPHCDAIQQPCLQLRVGQEPGQTNEPDPTGQAAAACAGRARVEPNALARRQTLATLSRLPAPVEAVSSSAQGVLNLKAILGTTPQRTGQSGGQHHSLPPESRHGLCG